MDYNSEPDIIQIHPPVIDRRDDGIYMYFHDLPPYLPKLRILPEETPPDEETTDSSENPPASIEKQQEQPPAEQ